MNQKIQSSGGALRIVTPEAGTAVFHAISDDGLTIRNRGSVINGDDYTTNYRETGGNHILVTGRDSVQEVGEWLAKLPADTETQSGTTAHFATNSDDPKKFLAGIALHFANDETASTQPHGALADTQDMAREIGASIGMLDNGSRITELAQRAIAASNEVLRVIDEMDEIETSSGGDDSYNPYEFTYRAPLVLDDYGFFAPDQLPDGLIPSILVSQTHANLSIHLGRATIGVMPFEPFRQLGAWILEGRQTVQKASIWG